MADTLDTTATPNSTTTTQDAPNDAGAAGGVADGAVDTGSAPADAGAAAADGGADGGAAAADPLDDAGLLDDVGKAKDGDADADADAKPKEGEDGEDGKGAGAAPLVGTAPEGDYELKAPEGRTLDPEATKLFAPIFKELTLTNEGAQRLVDAAPAFVDHVAAGVKADITNSVVETRKAWATAAQADPEIGGVHFEESKALCGKVFDRFGIAPDGEFRTLLKESGIGNHPDMIRTMVKIGRAIGEDSFDRGDNAKGEVPVWDKVYGGPTPAN